MAIYVPTYLYAFDEIGCYWPKSVLYDIIGYL